MPSDVSLILALLTLGHIGLYRYLSLEEMFSHRSIPLLHPAFNPTHPAFVYSMESRAFVHSAGPMHQLFEIMDHALQPIEDLEGLEFRIVAGAVNRLGIVTTAGSAYILQKRSQEVDLLEIDNVTHLGLGSNFEVVVVDDVVMVRGDSEPIRYIADVDEYGQLGRADTENFAELLRGKVANVQCSRWSTILEMHQ